MIAAARLGADAAYFTAVGADRFGQALTELWMREGVDASRIVVNGGAHTGLYFVTHGPDGHAFSYMRAGSAASRIGESDLPVDRIRADENPACLRHQPGDLVLGRRRGLRRDRHRPRRQAARLLRSEPAAEALAAAPGAGDHSRGDARLRHRAAGARRRAGADAARSDPDAIVDFYLRLGARVVVLKLGKAGAIVGDGESGASASPRARSRRSTRRARATVSTAPSSPNSFAHGRSVRRRALRQCRGGPLDAGLWRRRAAAAPRRRRGGDGAGKQAFLSGSWGARFTPAAPAPSWRHGPKVFPRLARRRSAPPRPQPRAPRLWLDARGDWDAAHDAAQADEGGAGDWVHAYLHRKEGDAGNAAYWYRRAGKPVCRARSTRNGRRSRKRS